MGPSRALAITAAVLIALVGGGLTWVVLSLESSQHRVRVESARQSDLRLALWRLDSWVAPRLANEAARPHSDYLSFYPERHAYVRSTLHEVETGGVLTPSPLLAEQADFVLLHFQVSPRGEVSSPQAPRGNFRDLAEDTFLSGDALLTNELRLTELESLFSPADIDARLDPLRARPIIVEGDGPDIRITPPGRAPAQTGRVPDRLASRQVDDEAKFRKGAIESTFSDMSSGVRSAPGQQEQWVMPQAEGGGYGNEQQFADTDIAQGGVNIVDAGPLQALWFDRPGPEPELVFARRVILASGEHIQGFWVDWAGLRTRLLALVTDLFPNARLVPTDAVDESLIARQMATLPVVLEADAGPIPPLPLVTPVRAGLVFGWLLALAGVGALGAMVRSIVELGRKRSRFASAVTHELRTPLTTFRLYTEMLADGIVSDEAARQDYLTTLKDESGRLAALVENVLAYARVEEGRNAKRREVMSASALLDRLRPQAEQRAEGGGASIDFTHVEPPDVRLSVDPDAVEQIVFNLIDNACKYGGASRRSPIRLTTGLDARTFTIRVSDDGDGVPAGKREVIFRPFERADEDSPKPGIGIGLALARALARDLGGDLVLERADRGATFALSLPLA